MTGDARRTLLFLGLLLLGGIPLRAELLAEVTAREVSLGESLRFSLTLVGDTGAGFPALDLPRGLEVVGTSRTSHIELVDGRMERQSTLLVELRAVRVGRFEIPSFSVRTRQGVVRSEPISVEVTEPPERAPESPASREEQGIFLDVQVEPTRVYLGEPLAYAARVFLREGFRHSRPPQAEPGRFEGFRVDDQDFDPSRGIWVDLATGRFSRFCVDRKILVAMEPGQHVLLPGKAQVVVEQATRSAQRRGNLWDMFRDFSDRQRGALSASPVTVEVLPLPEAGKPSDFRGIVGRDLGATVGVDRLEGQVGEPLEFEIVLEGQADLRGLKDLAPAFPGTVTVFETKGSSEIRWTEDGPRSRAAFQYVLVPTAPGPLSLPGLDLAYFDAAAGRYRRLRRNAPAVRVEGAAARVQAPSPVQRVAQARAQEEVRAVRFLRESPGELTPKQPPLHARTGGQAALAGLALLAMAIELAARWRDRFAGDALGLRAARAFGEVRGGLDGLDPGAPPREYYGRLLQLLKEYVAAKARRPAPGLTVDDLEPLLSACGVPEACRREGRDLFEHAERARYSPTASGDRTADHERARRWVCQVEGSWS